MKSRRSLRALPLLALLSTGCTLVTFELGRAPELVSLAELAPHIPLDMRYAGPDNFVATRIDGYGAHRCLLTPEAARAVISANAELAEEGLGLLLFDCYRPARAVDHFVRWAQDLDDQRTKDDYYPNVAKDDLLEVGYIAEQSSHSRASTVDVTLVRRGADGRTWPLDMGTRHDFFDERSWSDAEGIDPDARANRRRLRRAMERHGFRHYPQEWWHFTLAAEPYPDSYFDVPIR